MDTPLAPPLRLTPKYAPTSVSHAQVADTIGWFLNAYSERTGGVPSAGPKNAHEAMMAAAAFGSVEMDDGAAREGAGADGATQPQHDVSAAAGNTVITTQLNRLKEELRHS
ncbi:hypothetical protein K437DRAFT_180728 [Tilletiaria anomala UBC 951]|uniref:Uncharacterized protein n=1 Tax=Tilletiaria anomala (strain ATCC 24038 / CBS 436.72 / UBC 951) TaxID=1037660 RepID=A0A066VHU0_TILAU|nr:uncharacterized protein K437DRAFT_180728 [Tilletiaria anomala UBC 951]KDN41071.1 hypothetical protein K437DRAFT_180728 [Tilletiaria anomala UBC 951]